MLEKCFFKKESFKSVFKNGYGGAILNVRRQSIPEWEAATEKDLAPYVLKLTYGIESRCLDDERSWRDGM